MTLLHDLPFFVGRPDRVLRRFARSGWILGRIAMAVEVVIVLFALSLTGMGRTILFAVVVTVVVGSPRAGRIIFVVLVPRRREVGTRKRRGSPRRQRRLL
jgi:NAD/NADP transhydrogenase beta subunit